jgi:hypothetical protein
VGHQRISICQVVKLHLGISGVDSHIPSLTTQGASEDCFKSKGELALETSYYFLQISLHAHIMEGANEG